jgi:hypothetical protein
VLAQVNGTHASGLNQFFDEILSGELLSEQRILSVLQYCGIVRTQPTGIRVLFAANWTDFHVNAFRAFSGEPNTVNLNQAK